MLGVSPQHILSVIFGSTKGAYIFPDHKGGDRLFGHLMRRANSLEKTLMLGKIEGKRKREWQGMRLLEQHRFKRYEFEQTPEILEAEEPGVLQSMK